MSDPLTVYLPGSSVPATKPECVDCQVTRYSVRLDAKHHRDQQASLDVRTHLNDALRLLADPTTFERGAIRDAVLAAKRSLL